MTRSPEPLRCWRCGADLKRVPRPFSRFAECPACKVELHVCRMCRHYDLRYIGECNHEFADKVLQKEKANFCSHLKPSKRAYQGGEDSEKRKAEQELASLFDEGGAPMPAADEGETADKKSESEADAAKKRLKDLFGES